MTSSLRHWQLPAFGRQHLTLVETDLPDPGPGQILVRVDAVSLNYRDLLMIRDGMGMALDGPFTPGSDMAGTVLAAGTGVTRFAAGDRIVNTFWGGWHDGPWPSNAVLFGAPGKPGALASHMLLDAQWAVAAPVTLDAAQASTLPCAGLTAWFALVETGALRAGQTVLIHGTGGVALFGLQLARLHSAEVIVVSGNAGKRAQTHALGARHVLERGSDWPAEVRRLTGGRGADHVLETAGGDNLGRSLEATRQGGRVSVIGMLDGEELRAPFYALVLGRATVQGIGVGHRRALEELVRAVDAGAVQPVIAAEYPLEALHAALDHLERGAFGKIVVRT